MLSGMRLELPSLDYNEMEAIQENDSLYTLLKLDSTRLDSESSPALRPRVEEALSLGKKNLVLDLEEVNYMDSAGFSAILVVNRLCLEEEGQLILINTQDDIRRLIKMAHLEEILNLKVNLWDAIGDLITHPAS